MNAWQPLFILAAEEAEPGGGHGSEALFYIGPAPVTAAVVGQWLVMGFILLLFWLVVRRLEQVPCSCLQAALELAVEGLYGLFGGVMGPEKASRFVHLPLALFFFIIVSNYSGLIPLLPHTPWYKPPTSHWGVTIGLALAVFLYVHFTAVRLTGGRYYKHMFQPWWLSPLTFPLGLMEEIVKPFSLSLRLFVNIFAGETLLASLLALLVVLPMALPIPVMIMGIELITGAVQALIFSILTTTYIASVVGHDDHH